MEATQTRPAFDELTRERIRRGLRAYMEANRIGTPTLLGRIMEADAPRFREMPLSTLQRFIAGRHRTLDSYVGMCQQFLEKQGAALAPEFGEALHRFIGHAPSPAAEALPIGTALEVVADSYEIALTGAGQEKAYGEITLSRDPRQNYLHAQETVFGEYSDRLNRRERIPFSGAAVLSGAQLFVVLRNSLTRSPKCYAVSTLNAPGEPAASPRFNGEAFENPAGHLGTTHYAIGLSRRAGANVGAA